MKINDILIESVVNEHFAIGKHQVGNTVFDIRVHALDRLEERHVPVSTAKEMLRRIDANPEIQKQMEESAPYWIYDPTLDISMGMHNMPSGIMLWATSIIGPPRYKDGRYPIIEI